MYSAIVILIGLLAAEGWFIFRGFREYEKEVSYYMPMPVRFTRVPKKKLL